MKFNIYNPSTARRIIHNGLEESRKIEILPRHSVNGVELSDAVAERLQDLAKRFPDTELRLEPAAPVEGEAMKMTIDESKVGIVRATPAPALKAKR